VLARILESSGLSTIFVTNMPFWAERTGVPRTLAIEYPFGHILGLPHRRDQQMEVIQLALDILRSEKEPGTIIHSNAVWPIDQDQAMKDWQPPEPSPIIKFMFVEIKNMIRESRKN
jgi:hypothetical protein